MRPTISPLRAAIFGLAFAATQSPSTKAGAHDWYPIECCHDLDCAPVEHVERPGGDELVVTSRNGTGVVPKDMQRRQSRDHRMHVCMQPSGDGRMRVICVFVPPLI